MYGRTTSIQIPLEFYVSVDMWINRGVLNGVGEDVRSPVEQAVSWFMSFLYPPRIGEAPLPMLVVWPEIMATAYAVESVDFEYQRFSRDLTPRSAKITVGGYELRKVYRTQDDMVLMGLMNTNPDLSHLEQYTNSILSSGARLNLGPVGKGSK
jgi:hypothetical protein